MLIGLFTYHLGKLSSEVTGLPPHPPYFWVTEDDVLAGLREPPSTDAAAPDMTHATV